MACAGDNSSTHDSKTARATWRKYVDLNDLMLLQDQHEVSSEGLRLLLIVLTLQS